MATKQATDRVLLPSPGPRPVEISACGRVYRSPITVTTGIEKGKPVMKIVKSKTAVIPAVVVSRLMADEKGWLKIEKKLVPLAADKK